MKVHNNIGEITLMLKGDLLPMLTNIYNFLNQRFVLCLCLCLFVACLFDFFFFTSILCHYNLYLITIKKNNKMQSYIYNGT